ncbi:hypothetical protein CCH79_00019214 [Gambusia affinis]|uniref:Agouti-signaling protein n=2 Tax=Gambusia affinis TaxID=33528 RepID=A0A315UQ76_GAMAF|nr:hypothetical protein CCH79_00019214 [Gambusia affinis]
MSGSCWDVRPPDASLCGNQHGCLTDGSFYGEQRWSRLRAEPPSISSSCEAPTQGKVVQLNRNEAARKRRSERGENFDGRRISWRNKKRGKNLKRSEDSNQSRRGSRKENREGIRRAESAASRQAQDLQVGERPAFQDGAERPDADRRTAEVRIRIGPNRIRNWASAVLMTKRAAAATSAAALLTAALSFLLLRSLIRVWVGAAVTLGSPNEMSFTLLPVKALKNLFLRRDDNLSGDFLRTMQAFLPLGCCVLALTQCCLGSAHMIPDDRLSTNRVVASNALSHSLQVDPPPVVIVELNKPTKKKEKGKKQKKNKFARKRPPPPPDCVPLWGSCKAPGNVCCDFCAFCQCRLFKTVCLCRMGNPRC